MSETLSTLPAEADGTEVTRFNALRHGVLSRYTVLPWENAEEYNVLVAALATEHAPQGPTEEHLVEELAGILWRKRRLRLAESASYRRGLDDHGAFLPQRHGEGGAGASRRQARSEWIEDAIRATAADTADAFRDMHDDEAMTHRALDLLNSDRITSSEPKGETGGGVASPPQGPPLDYTRSPPPSSSALGVECAKL